MRTPSAIAILMILFIRVDLSQGQTRVNDFTFPEIRIGADHSIVVNEAIPAHLLLNNLPNSFTKVIITEKAQTFCQIDANDIPSLTASENFAHLFQSPFSARRPLTLVIDSFNEKRSLFRSYFLPKQNRLPTDTIGIDCSPEVKTQWRPLIAHELVHYQMNGMGFDSGFEEGIAQYLEVLEGGDGPLLSLNNLKNIRADQIPSIFERRRPLPSNESYGIQYLFIKYLAATFGGQKALAAILSPDAMTYSITQNLKGMNRIARRLELFLIQQGNQALADRANSKDLLRLFAVASTLNLSYFSLYQIPGWNAFKALISNESFSEPTSCRFAYLKNPRAADVARALNTPGMEGYSFHLKTSSFEISPLVSNTSLTSDLLERVLLLNLSCLNTP